MVRIPYLHLLYKIVTQYGLEQVYGMAWPERSSNPRYHDVLTPQTVQTIQLLICFFFWF